DVAGLEGAAGLGEPAGEDLLVERARRGEGDRDRLELGVGRAVAALGEAPVEDDAGEPEVVGDTEGGLAGAGREGLVGPGGEGDLRRRVAEDVEAVDDGVLV